VCEVVNPVFTRIRFTAAAITRGATRNLTATGLDQFDQPLATQPTFTWFSDNTSVLTVDENTGAAHGVAVGTANVTVKSGVIEQTAVVTVADIPSLVITELYGNPLGTDTQGEWMEIYNPGATAIDLAGFALKSNGSNPEDHVISALVIPAGACVVLGSNPAIATNGGVPLAYSYGSSASIILNNSQTDWVTIKTPDGLLVDSVAYAIRPDGATPNNFSPFTNDGFSYELSFLALDNTTLEGGHWGQSANVFNPNVKGTPGTCPPAAQVLTSVVVTATSVNLAGTKQLTATARDQNGNTMFSQPGFTWSSTDPSIVSVDPSTGVATGAALGSTVVSAATGTIFGSATITVVDPDAVGSISISGNAPSNMPAGYVAPHFINTVKRADGTAITPTPALTWQTSDPTIATIDNLGYMTALRPGSVSVTARAASGVVSNSWNYTLTPRTVQHTAVYRDHVEFGRPSDGGDNNDLILTKPQFTLSYNAARGGPNWVSWQLNATHFGTAPRCDCFTPDDELPASVYRVVDLDYRNSGFTRGHMVMSEERTATLQENATSFLLTNILPQANANNSGPWLALESHLNDVSRNSGKEIYIVAGGVYAPNAPTLKNEGRVAIPHSVWKVALILNSGTGLGDVDELSDVQAIAVIMPNVGPDGKTAIATMSNVWQNYETTIDAVEAATGFDVLKLLADEIEIPLEAKDQPPVARLSAPASSTEGSLVSFDASGTTDADAGDVITYKWSFGDGTGSVFADAQPTHTYANDGVYTVTVTAFDRVGAFSTATKTISVSNVLPAVGPFAGATLLPGETYTASGAFSDPGSDSWTATVNYGDGSASQPLTLTGSSFSLSHTYTTAGTYTVTVNVTDDDATGTRTQSVVVLTPQQALRTLGVVLLDVVGTPNVRSLESKLDVAMAAITRGNQTAAANQLNAFLNELDALVRSGRVTPAAALPIRTMVDRVLTSISR
jgi:DNA/RNA endonuclease G (NUC1)